jgi:hypothetical protein
MSRKIYMKKIVIVVDESLNPKITEWWGTANVAENILQKDTD